MAAESLLAMLCGERPHSCARDFVSALVRAKNNGTVITSSDDNDADEEPDSPIYNRTATTTIMCTIGMTTTTVMTTVNVHDDETSQNAQLQA